jgi:hypothetical protein
MEPTPSTYHEVSMKLLGTHLTNLSRAQSHVSLYVEFSLRSQDCKLRIFYQFNVMTLIWAQTHGTLSCLIDPIRVPNTLNIQRLHFTDLKESPSVSYRGSVISPVLRISSCPSLWSSGLVQFPFVSFYCTFCRVLILVSRQYHPAPSNYISTTDCSTSISINCYFEFTRTLFESTPLKVCFWNQSNPVNSLN